MDKFFTELFSKYGLLALIGGIFGILIIWWGVHSTAAPGKNISVLWGLVEYTKPNDKAGKLSHRSTQTITTPVALQKAITSGPKPEPAPAIEIETGSPSLDSIDKWLQNYRSNLSLRELTAFESGKIVSDLPAGSYFYVSVAYLKTDTESYEAALWTKKADRFAFLDLRYEVHKGEGGELYLVGFLTFSEAANMSSFSGKVLKSAVLSPIGSDTFPSFVRIPVGRIVSAAGRDIQLSSDNELSVLDIVVQ